MESARGVVVTTENYAYIKEFSYPLFESCRPVLDGWIETVHPKGLERPFVMLVNEEGLLMEKPLNLTGSFFYGTHEHGQPIVGNIILMKIGYRDGERDIVGLDEDEASDLLNRTLALPFAVVKKEEK